MNERTLIRLSQRYAEAAEREPVELRVSQAQRTPSEIVDQHMKEVTTRRRVFVLAATCVLTLIPVGAASAQGRPRPARLSACRDLRHEQHGDHHRPGRPPPEDPPDALRPRGAHRHPGQRRAAARLNAAGRRVLVQRPQPDDLRALPRVRRRPDLPRRAAPHRRRHRQAVPPGVGPDIPLPPGELARGGRRRDPGPRPHDHAAARRAHRRPRSPRHARRRLGHPGRPPDPDHATGGPAAG